MTKAKKKIILELIKGQRNAPEVKEIIRMALTRKFLAALGIENDKIDEIITAHSDTVNALKGERDEYKEAAEKLPNVEKELNELKKQSENGNPFEEKYNKVKKDFDEYKKGVEADKLLRDKKKAFKNLLKDSNIGDEYIDEILSVTKFDDYEIEDGKIKNADKEQIQKKWKSFVVKTETRGAGTEQPPSGSGSKMTKEQILAIKDTAQRQQAMAENADLFGI